MLFPFYISKKYIFSKKDSRFINFISSIAIIGIALGCAALIIALSILGGFERTIISKIVGFDSHIQIISSQSVLPDYHLNIRKIEYALDANLDELNPYASKLAIIGKKRIKEGITLKGIIFSKPNTFLKKDIVEGKFDLLSDSSIIIGKKLANKLSAKIGDRLTLFALKNDKIPSADNLPNIKLYYITGIYESGMAEYDDLTAYCNLHSAQELFNLGDFITGYDIKLKNISNIDSTAALLAGVLEQPHYVRTIYQSHRNIFTWIELQKKPIPIVLGLIIIVAVFNIISTLLMMVMEKTNAIGILKSLGANKRKIVSIFLIHGVFISSAGVLVGNLLAFILTYLQLKFSIISLPSSVYFMSTVPIYLSLFNFLIVSGITFILGIVASVIPSIIASKIQPINALRFN